MEEYFKGLETFLLFRTVDSMFWDRTLKISTQFATWYYCIFYIWKKKLRIPPLAPQELKFGRAEDFKRSNLKALKI